MCVGSHMNLHTHLFKLPQSLKMKLRASNIKEYLANAPQITFEVTERCSLSCKYCGYGPLYINKGTRLNRNMPSLYAIEFMKYMKGLWDEGFLTATERVVDISFYGGEPLLNFDLIKDIVEYIEHNLYYLYINCN